MNSSAPSLSRRRFVQLTSLGLAAAAMPAWTAEAAGTGGYQIGCYTRCFDQFDYKTALDCIAEAGYEHVGIMTAKGKGWVILTPETPPDEIAELAQEIRQRKLRALSVYADFGAQAAQSVDLGISALRKIIDATAVCGSPNLMIGGTTDAKVFENYYKCVTECCSYAEQKKVALSVKPHGGQNATGQQCRAIIERIANSNFRVWYDPGNIFYYSDGKLDPLDDCPHVDGIVAGISVKDFMPPKEVLVTPGSGKVDFPKLLSRMRKGGFTKGPLIVECVQRAEREKAIQEAKKARLLLLDWIHSL